MKKVLFIIFALFAFAVRADNTITAKSYVDTAAAGLQEQISANDANTVLTYTNTAGTVGEKKIYDASDDYASQQDALVTAGAFNTAIQNALETEFVCIERQAGTGGCLLYKIKNAFNPSQNLFRGPYYGALSSSVSYMLDAHGHSYYDLISSPFNPPVMFKGPLFVATVTPGEKYYISGVTDAMYAHYAFYESEEDIKDRTKVISYSYFIASGKGVTAPNNAHVLVAIFTNDDTRQITWSDVQCVHGSSSVPYQPYGENTYLPQAN